MSYVLCVPIALPGDSHGSGEPFPCRERQPRHGEYWVTVVVSWIAADPARSRQGAKSRRYLWVHPDDER
jgi:hypothetical protein